MIIVPTILTSHPQELATTLKRLEPHFDRVQIDIIDGQFAANTTISPEVLKKITTSLKIDFHLMVKHPASWIDRCLPVADRIIAQIEHMPDQQKFLQQVKNKGARSGLALDLNTPLFRLAPPSLSLAQTLLLMSVPAGFGGQHLNEKIYAKIRQAKTLRHSISISCSIYVDGGVNQENIRHLAQAGADEVAVGRHLTQGNITANLKTLRQALVHDSG